MTGASDGSSLRLLQDVPQTVDEILGIDRVYREVKTDVKN
jgi:hypothetical protein